MTATQQKPRKEQKLSKVKERLWKLVSQYVRQGAADMHGNCTCVTCGLVRPWKEMQAGHFIARAQGNATYFELDNIHPQCFRCNINLGGNGPEYYPYMVERYGQDRVDELRRLSKTTRKFTVDELLELEAYYEALTKELE